MIRLLVCVFVSFSVAGNEISPEQMEKFKKELWSLQQPLKIDVEQEGWCKTPIDGFILKKLKEQSLSPSGQASKRTLIRRAYYNLIGLPPTAAEIQRFENDHSERAYEKLIDDLLTKKEYGEKWARHWMDVARFADTQGFLPANRDQSYPFSYTYRDYLIRAFNTDKSYKDFIIEQLAADQVELKDKRDLAALGFQTAADRFLNKRHEIINDRIDVTTQGFLGLTVACSRCHDHKFDPIPTADYYSLYGIFASTEEPKVTDLPIINLPENKQAYQKYQRAYEKLQKEKESIYAEYRENIFKDWQEVAADYFIYISKSIAGFKGLKKIDSKGREMRPRLIIDIRYMLTRDRKNDPFFGLLNRSLRINNSKIPGLIKGTLKRGDNAEFLKEALSGKTVKTKDELFSLYSELIKKVISEKDKYPVVYDSFAGKAFKELLAKNDVKRYVSNAEDDKITKIDNRIKKHLASEGAPARAMVVKDKAKPTEPYIFERGKPDSRGPKVPRRFLQALSYEKYQEKFTEGSGRLELAKSIADDKNPLTARVLVNRVWQWHFGQGIVNTPSNFGVLGSKPSHPELLDYLAVWFMENGWSIKKLNKLIMTSAVYQQKSDLREDMAEIDEANVYLWKMNRRRLGWEELRDSVVQATGKLKRFPGGKSVTMLQAEYQPYRTVYGYLFRDKIPGVYKAFDFPAAEITCEFRTKTIVPQQGLFLMNSNFMVRSSRMTAANLSGQKEEKVRKLFTRIYGRQPVLEEVDFANEFLEQATESFKERVFPEWLYGFANLNDEDKLEEFTEFTFFNKSRWQISKSFPDKRKGYAFLSEKGGHPGNGDIAVVRRCKMHRTGNLSIKGLLQHKNDKGDGVRVLVLHNGSKLGEWDCKKSSIPTELENVKVMAGDIVDLVVDSKKTPTSDSFIWPVSMSMTMPTSNEEITIDEDFKKVQKLQSFSAWHGLAQVLMMSNEFLYVD
ncbi:MAG: DUF1549 and DUF1553 domain-containing protein [Lentisphaerales bacterium]|nr:DUF1549 and DUF1553 domain-containing protein [Lentisphaerales bacterium]